MKDLLELGTCNVTLDYLSAVAQQGTRATRGDEARDLSRRLVLSNSAGVGRFWIRKWCARAGRHYWPSKR